MNFQERQLFRKLGEAILQVCDNADDEGDRVYFGSTNHFDELKDAKEVYEDWWFKQPKIVQDEREGN